MVTTSDQKLWEKMWSFKDHGKSYDAVYRSEHPTGFRWLHDSFGTNWRMLEMQAAIGRLQLKKMSEWTAKRNLNAGLIWDACRPYASLRVPDFRCNRITCNKFCVEKSGCIHACYKCYVYVRPEKLADGWTRDGIVKELNKQGVPCYHGTCSEIYLEKCFEQTNFRPARRLPAARMLGETSLMFLVHPTLSESEMNKSCEVIQSVLSSAGK
jgi:dTDP-4-amino-4,6-dideoxygalactose transaminase